MTNPWNLTQRQAEAMDALVETGADKLAADRMGVSVNTFHEHVAAAMRHMGLRLRLHAVIWWDRWRREDGEDATA